MDAGALLRVETRIRLLGGFVVEVWFRLQIAHLSLELGDVRGARERLGRARDGFETAAVPTNAWSRPRKAGIRTTFFT
jgi:hypothetical protein